MAICQSTSRGLSKGDDMRASSLAIFTAEEAKAETRDRPVESTKQGNNCRPRPLFFKEEKPPLGIMPKKIWIEQRMKVIGRAMFRYLEAGKEIPEEWKDEYVSHLGTINQ